MSVINDARKSKADYDQGRQAAATWRSALNNELHISANRKRKL